MKGGSNLSLVESFVGFNGFCADLSPSVSILVTSSSLNWNHEPRLVDISIGVQVQYRETYSASYT